MAALALGSCGGAASPRVGDCVDSHDQVVDCSSPSATQKLVSDLTGPHATACIVIGANPEKQVTVDSHPFCAKRK